MAEHDFKNYPELSNKQMEEFEFASPHKQIKESFEGVVANVHDGDTITIRTTFRNFEFPVRLLDIDAPELSEGGQDARDWLAGQIQGENVQIIIDPNNRVGKYGRLLGKIMHLGMDMGNAMMRMGMVVAFGMKNQGQVPNINKLMRIEQWL